MPLTDTFRTSGTGVNSGVTSASTFRSNCSCNSHQQGVLLNEVFEKENIRKIPKLVVFNRTHIAGGDAEGGGNVAHFQTMILSLGPQNFAN